MQVSYEPSFDANHAAFRILRLHAGWPEGGAELSCVLICDLYTVFPHFVASCRVQRDHVRLRNLVVKQYGGAASRRLPDPATLLSMMRPYQHAALRALAQARFLSDSHLDQGLVKRGSLDLPEEVRTLIEERNSEQAELYGLLRVLISTYSSMGSDGLKSRSGLMEFRYDDV